MWSCNDRHILNFADDTVIIGPLQHGETSHGPADAFVRSGDYFLNTSKTKDNGQVEDASLSPSQIVVKGQGILVSPNSI